MAGERTYPILPCPDLDEAIAFYEALGFSRTYRQIRPNPYGVVAREDITIHLCGIAGFDPATSVSSVIITVPDIESLHADFVVGLRRHVGGLPVSGIPRILRPRRKQGTATGFSVVDVGGNWLRFYRIGASTEPQPAQESGLAAVLANAARQGDARGDDRQALAVLDRGLASHQDAPSSQRVRALLYRVELLVRTGQPEPAARSLAQARSLVTDQDAAELADELDHAEELLHAQQGTRAGVVRDDM